MRKLFKLRAREPPRMRLVVLVAAASLLTASSTTLVGAGALEPGTWSHAFAIFGEPKYPTGFAHYNYVNPDAPKRGILNLGNPDRASSFNGLNPYLLKTTAPFGVEFFSFETLCDPSQDEAGVMYGLVAEAIMPAPDLSSVAFRVNPRAHFNNGDPVTAADVKHSFDMLISDKASPSYSGLLQSVARSAAVVDARTVRFELATKSRDAIYTLGTSLTVFSPKWGMSGDGKAKPFDEVINDIPITTGAYVVAATEAGRRLDLMLDKNYWGRNEGVRRGFFNFERIVYRYYADYAVQLEAFKAHEIDLFWETNLRRWGRQFKGSKFGTGKIIAKALPTGQGTYPRALVFNLRRPIFQDIRVREALQLSFDFEWLNAQNFNYFARVDSAFSNSEYAAKGLPSPGELNILGPFRQRLPAAVFGPPYENPRTDTSPTALRENLKRARDLLAEAGWKLGSGNVLHNAEGKPFEIEILNNDADIAASVEPWQPNLTKLGIRSIFRQVDFAVFVKRLEAFDFDITQLNIGEFLMPSPAILFSYYASSQADIEASANYGGIKDPALDAAIGAMNHAATKEEFLDATRAFDRVLMQQRYFIPWSRRPAFNSAWWDRFGIPQHPPRFFTLLADTNNARPWPILTWWDTENGANSEATP